MAINVEYMHVCDYAFVGDAGKPGFIGIFENINAQTVPIAITMHLGIKLVGNANEAFHVRIQIGRPNGNVLSEINAQGAVNAEATAFLCIGINGAQFPDYGRYTVRVLSGAETLVSQSLRVQRVGTPAQAPPSPVGAH